MKRLTARGVRALLVGVPFAFLAVFFVWPVGAIVARGLWTDGAPHLRPLVDLARDPSLRHVIGFTFTQAALSTVMTLFVAVPATAVMSRYQFRGRTLVGALLTMPFVLPTVVVGTAFRSLGISGSLPAIITAHVFFNVAVVVRVVGASWRGLDRREEEAARVLGCGPVRTFLRVTLPALRPAIVAASSIVFLFCFTSFGVILILGGPQFATIETEIYRQTAQLLDLETAAALSIVQLVAVIAALALAGSMTGRVRAVVGRPRARTIPPGRRRALVGVALLPAIILVVVPLGDLLIRSFAHGAAGYTHLTTTPFGAARAPLDAVVTSIEVAMVATAIAVALGLALATALTRPSSRRGARITELVVMLPLGVSAVTVGFGFLIVFDTPPLDLRTSWWIIPIAHALVALPFVVRTTLPVLRAIDPHQREAAAMLGAGPVQVWRAVELPVVAHAVRVAAGFAAAISLGEFGATLFIVRPETTTVPVAIYRFLSRPGATNVDQAMALATLLMALTGLAALAAERRSRVEVRP